MNAYELAKRYYPKQWNIDRLRKLVEKGQLSEEQFEEITGYLYDEGSE